MKNNSKVEKNSSKSLKQTKHGDKGKWKKLAESLPFPVSEEEEQKVAPLITKRKRSSPAARPKNSLVPQLFSHPAPSPDKDDHVSPR